MLLAIMAMMFSPMMASAQQPEARTASPWKADDAGSAATPETAPAADAAGEEAAAASTIDHGHAQTRLGNRTG
jgi:hypothetical protein